VKSEAAKKNETIGTRSLLVSLGISLIIILGALMLIKGLDAAQLVSRLLWPLSRLMFFITIGLLVGQIIEVSGWIKQMAVLARPLFRFGHLGDHCSAAFTTAFFSGVSANAISTADSCFCRISSINCRHFSCTCRPHFLLSFHLPAGQEVCIF